MKGPPNETHTLPFRPPSLCLGLLVLLLTLGSGLRASAADTNTITSITPSALNGGPTIEITLTSTRPFTVRDEGLLLQVGATTFTLSHSPTDGSLYTIIFVLTPAQYAAIKTGDPVTAYFESDAPTSPDAWQFGKFDKTLLK